MSVLKRMKDFVKQIVDRIGKGIGKIITPAEAKLASDLVIGISEGKTVLLSETARVVNQIENKTGTQNLKRTEKRLSKPGYWTVNIEANDGKGLHGCSIEALTLTESSTSFITSCKNGSSSG